MNKQRFFPESDITKDTYEYMQGKCRTLDLRLAVEGVILSENTSLNWNIVRNDGKVIKQK